MALEDEIREIKTRISQAQGRQVRAQVEREAAERALAAAREALRVEYGVTTPEEARAVLASLEADLEKALTTAREALG